MRADLDAFARIFTDPVVMRYVAWGRPFTLPEVEELLERMIARFEIDGFGQFTLERHSDGTVMGRVGLLPLDPGTWQGGSFRDLGAGAEIEIGWTLARDHWGRGHATEAAVLVREWAWNELRLSRLVSIIQHGNDRSVRLAEKLGGRPERDITTSFGKDATLFAYEPQNGSESRAPWRPAAAARGRRRR